MRLNIPTISITFALFLSTLLFGTASSADRESSFTPSAEPSLVGCGDQWDTTFTSNGANNQVNAIVSDGNGNTYIGGEFSSVQGLPANGIAKWDGTSWTALGSGIIGEIRSIVVSGSNLYVGGDFNSPVSDGFARNVAKWDGTSWTRLNNGLGGGTHFVYSLVVYNNEVFATGGFNTADGSPTTGTAKWDGSAWVAVGTGAPMGNFAVVKYGKIYVGSNGVAVWDGTTWSAMAGVTGAVSSIAFLGSDMYAVGTPNIGSGSINVAKWNGTAWTSMGTFASGLMNAVAVHNGELYVGGSIPSSTFNSIARWNGTAWVGLGSGVTGGTSIGERVMALASIGGTLYVGGNYAVAGGQGAQNISRYASGTWTPFSGTGLDSSANAIAVSGKDVYVGGGFTSAGPLTANRIAKWDSVANSWATLGAGVTGFDISNVSISAIAVAGGKVYAGGNFTNIGNVAANGIAVWNGTTWAPLGTGVAGGNGRVSFIIVRGEDVYVGGDFATAGGVTASRVAKWNGTAWSGLNSAHIPTTMTGMAFMGNDLYVSTGTTTVANPAYFSKYDGTTWTMLGTDLGDRGVSSIAVIGSDVYVGGGFITVNGMTVNNIVKWNGSTWSALGNGLPPTGFGFGAPRLAAAGNDLIATGSFTVAGGGPADRIARWNGTAWTGLGTGLNVGANAITAAGGDIFVGGSFATAGCNASPYFARWRQTAWTATTNTDWHTISNWGSSTIPTTGEGVTISSSNAVISSANVTLGSLIVTGGRTVTIGAGRTLTVTGSLDLSNGTIDGPGTLIVDDLTLNNGNIAGLGGITVNGNLYLNGGVISGSNAIALTSCRTSAISGGSTTSFVSSPLTRCVNSAGTYRFPVGSNSVYAPVELSAISGTGSFTVEPKTGAYPAATGLPLNRLQRWWNMTNGGITQADVNFSYIDPEVVGIEGRYRAYRIDSGAAQLIPTVLNYTTNKATVAGATSFAAFTLAEGPATFEMLNGRITTPRGRGADRVIVTITDQAGNVRNSMTNGFGYFRFPNTETFKNHTIRLQSRKYIFTQPERTFEFIESAPVVTFVSTNH